MKKTQSHYYSIFLLFAASLSAQTTFDPDPAGGAIHDAANWTNGLPTSGNPGTIMVDGSGTTNHVNTWMRYSEVVVGGGATLTMGEDLGARGGVLTINDATVYAADAIFTGGGGTIIFNPGSSGNSVKGMLAQAGNAGSPSSIVINGGTHSAGRFFGSEAVYNEMVMTGGQITAGDFKFDGTGNVIGGTAVLLSSSEATTLSMLGSTNILSDWSGSWTVGSFDGSDWRDELTGGGWTYNDVAIDSSVFDASFQVTNGGQTLSAIPEPSNFTAILGLVSLSFLTLRRK